MSKIKIILKDGDFLFDGKQIIFKAPCDGSEVTSLIIEDTEYSLVDSCNRDVSGCAYSFEQYAFVSALLDTKNKKAYIINAGQHKLSTDLAEGTFVVKKAENDSSGAKIVDVYARKSDLTEGNISVRATYATCDKNGLHIDSNYAKISELADGTIVPKKASAADTSNIKKAESTQSVYYPVTIVSSLDEKAQTIHVTDKLSINTTTGALKATRFEGTADKATKDGSGNVIADTYASKAALEDGTITPKQATILSPTEGTVTIPINNVGADIRLPNGIYIFYNSCGQIFILNSECSIGAYIDGKAAYWCYSTMSTYKLHNKAVSCFLAYEAGSNKLHFYIQSALETVFTDETKTERVDMGYSWVNEEQTFRYIRIA